MSDKKNIVVVEDDLSIAELIKDQLELEDYNVKTFSSADKILSYLNNNNSIDLFLLDIMLPGLSGIDLCKVIRANEKFLNIPIVMLTALSDKTNIIKALDIGANDYITKPFDIDELLARIRVQLRSKSTLNKSSSNDIIQIDDLQVYVNEYKVLINQVEVKLTLSEFKILKILVSNLNKVFSRDQIIEEISGENFHVTTRTIDTHIVGLRKKIDKYSHMIETIRGVGYRFNK